MVLLQILGWLYVGGSWHRNDNWLEGEPCGNNLWYGVKCTNGLVDSISLPSNRLNGSVSAWRRIENITSLQVLDLSDNLLGGPLPKFWTWSNELLLLNMSHNQITGATLHFSYPSAFSVTTPLSS